AAQPGRELDPAAQEGPRDGARAAQPLHRRNGARPEDRQGRSARETQGLARRVRAQGPGRRCRGRGRGAMTRRRAAPWIMAGLLAACMTAPAQTTPSPSPPPPCPASVRELPPEALYGRWEARIDGQPGVAELRLARHPEYAGV